MNNVFKHLYHPVPSSTVSCRSVSYCWQKRGINITSTLQEAKGGSTPRQGFTKIYVTEIHIDVGKKRIHTISFILSDHKCYISTLCSTCVSWCLSFRVQEASSWVMLVRSSVVCDCSPSFMSPKSTLGTPRVTIGPYNNQNMSIKRSQTIFKEWHECQIYAMNFLYLKRDFHSQSDGFVTVLYVAHETGCNLLWFPSSHNQVEIKTLVFL